MTIQNLFSNIPNEINEEFLEILASGSGDFKIERIVSRGHQSPPQFWYDQDTIEWVLLLKGAAQIQFQEQAKLVELTPGDWIEIPAHSRHRVASTSENDDTVWLAVHWK